MADAPRRRPPGRGADGGHRRPRAAVRHRSGGAPRRALDRGPAADPPGSSPRAPGSSRSRSAGTGSLAIGPATDWAAPRRCAGAGERIVLAISSDMAHYPPARTARRRPRAPPGDPRPRPGGSRCRSRQGPASAASRGSPAACAASSRRCSGSPRSGRRARAGDPPRRGDLGGRGRPARPDRRLPGGGVPGLIRDPGATVDP